MARRAAVLIAVIAVMLSPAVIVRGADEAILKLALQRTDMPATTKKSTFTYPELSDPLTLRGFGAREGAHYSYRWPVGTLNTPIGQVDKEWVIEGDVFRSADESGAKRLFALGKAAKSGFFSSLEFPGEPRSFNLPAFGDEQFTAAASGDWTGLHLMVFVRKGPVVWQLQVATSPLQFKATEAQMIEVLQTYAAKQHARVG